MEAVVQDLDNPVWCAVAGPQRGLGVVGSRAGLFDADVAPFAGLRDAGQVAFEELAALAGPGRVVAFATASPVELPRDWTMVRTEALEQFACLQIADAPAGDDAVAVLQGGDVPMMLALTQATEPGPFSSGTHRMGRYIGVRTADGGGLAAMAGERLRLPGAVEISAVCTAAGYRGRGLAARLVRILTADALERGLTPFLHVRPGNGGAIRVYEALGFRHRATMTLTLGQPPGR